MGIGRSGSTLLDLMLSSNNACFSLGEVSKFSEIYQKSKSFRGACHGSTFWEDSFNPKELELLAKGLSNHRLNSFIPLKLERWVRELLRQDKVLNPYSLIFSKVKENVLIDSSKYVDWVTKKLSAREFRQGLVNTYIVHMVRDGRAVLNSYLRNDPKMTVQEISQYWLQQVQASCRFYQQFPANRKMTVRYEELATKPAVVMKSVCELLNIEYSAEMLEYWKFEHHGIVGSLGTRSLVLRYQGKDIGERVRKIHGERYERMDFSINLDLRWQEELSPQKLKEFNHIVGNLNRPYEWDP